MKYKVRLLKLDNGYAVWVPGIPGCSTFGRTREEALDKIRSVLLAYLEALDDDESGLESSTVEI
ncbi:MAG: type II toxin-antitoxin system HicB family antitoxin [Candidatus Aminicenantes bacterium]|nr:type II toxin-antitoxin system HicB family antitoxin [Candidatus Aminicenantes bacterium]